MKKFIKKIIKNDLAFSFIITSIIFVCVLFLFYIGTKVFEIDPSEFQPAQKCHCECVFGGIE